jgi:hypothetical protein
MFLTLRKNKLERSSLASILSLAKYLRVRLEPTQMDYLHFKHKQILG